jgi:hypothetical protein
VSIARQISSGWNATNGLPGPPASELRSGTRVLPAWRRVEAWNHLQKWPISALPVPQFRANLTNLHSPLAQLVEQAAVNRRVAGSSPAGGAERLFIRLAARTSLHPPPRALTSRRFAFLAFLPKGLRLFAKEFVALSVARDSNRGAQPIMNNGLEPDVAGRISPTLGLASETQVNKERLRSNNSATYPGPSQQFVSGASPGFR